MNGRNARNTTNEWFVRWSRSGYTCIKYGDSRGLLDAPWRLHRPRWIERWIESCSCELNVVDVAWTFSAMSLSSSSSSRAHEQTNQQITSPTNDRLIYLVFSIGCAGDRQVDGWSHLIALQVSSPTVVHARVLASSAPPMDYMQLRLRPFCAR